MPPPLSPNAPPSLSTSPPRSRFFSTGRKDRSVSPPEHSATAPQRQNHGSSTVTREAPRGSSPPRHIDCMSGPDYVRALKLINEAAAEIGKEATRPKKETLLEAQIKTWTKKTPPEFEKAFAIALTAQKAGIKITSPLAILKMCYNRAEATNSLVLYQLTAELAPYIYKADVAEEVRTLICTVHDALLLRSSSNEDFHLFFEAAKDIRSKHSRGGSQEANEEMALQEMLVCARNIRDGIEGPTENYYLNHFAELALSEDAKTREEALHTLFKSVDKPLTLLNDCFKKAEQTHSLALFQLTAILAEFIYQKMPSEQAGVRTLIQSMHAALLLRSTSSAEHTIDKSYFHKFLEFAREIRETYNSKLPTKVQQEMVLEELKVCIKNVRDNIEVPTKTYYAREFDPQSIVTKYPLTHLTDQNKARAKELYDALPKDVSWTSMRHALEFTIYLALSTGDMGRIRALSDKYKTPIQQQRIAEAIEEITELKSLSAADAQALFDFCLSNPYFSLDFMMSLAKSTGDRDSNIKILNTQYNKSNQNLKEAIAKSEALERPYKMHDPQKMKKAPPSAFRSRDLPRHVSTPTEHQTHFLEVSADDQQDRGWHTKVNQTKGKKGFEGPLQPTSQATEASAKPNKAPNGK